ncbi:MAG TPA: hypothetical protein VM925_05420 [Labilithrix sp.]|nr:hypothetical protein [Labilithrix sp.]
MSTLRFFGRTPRYLLLTLFLLCVAACGRWADNVPRTVSAGAGHGPLVYDAALTTLRHKGYRVIEVDERRGYLRAVAKLDGDLVLDGSAIAARVSFFSFQAYPDGTLRATASGYHVRDDDTRIHVKLDQELRELLWAIEQSAKHAASQAPAPVASSATTL